MGDFDSLKFELLVQVLYGDIKIILVFDYYIH